MSIEMRVSWSFGSVPETPPEPPDLVAFDGLVHTHEVAQDLLLLTHPRTGQKGLVRRDARSVLEVCKAFRSLDEHAETVARQFPPLRDHPQEIRRVLGDLLKVGMLRSGRAFCQGLRPQPRDSADIPLVGVILTCERPPALERLLGSLNRTLREGDLESLWVVDDSFSEANRRANAQLVSEYGTACPAPLRYFGIPDQKAWLERLVAALPEAEASIRFLLDPDCWREGERYGRARNLALLLSAGRRAVLFDDDACNDLYDPPVEEAGIAFSTRDREAAFFGAPREWAKFRRSDGDHAVRCHGRVLGLSLAQALDALGIERVGVESLRTFPPALLPEIHGGSPILTSALGTFGDPGTLSLRWFFSLSPASRNRLLRSEATLTQALTHRRSWLGRTRPTFIPFFNLSQVVGLDNRAQLPPYFPAFRGEDRLFGQMVRFLYPDSLCLEQSASIVHQPIPERGVRDDQFMGRPPEHFPYSILAHLFPDITGFQDRIGWAADLRTRYHSLAQIFFELAGTSHEHLRHRHFTLLTESQVQMARLLERVARETREAPRVWTERVQRDLQENRARFARPWDDREPPIRGIPEDLAEEPLLRFWRTHWARFARALIAWPRIRDVASQCPPEG